MRLRIAEGGEEDGWLNEELNDSRMQIILMCFESQIKSNISGSTNSC